jgi:DNA-binding PadR family transcriptional regulator
MPQSDTKKSLKDLPALLHESILWELLRHKDQGRTLKEVMDVLNTIHENCGLNLLSEGTLSAAFKRVREKGWVNHRWGNEVEAADRIENNSKRYYTITDEGIEVLKFADNLHKVFYDHLKQKLGEFENLP